MRVFVDTSAIIALLSTRDRWHLEAARTYRGLLASRATFVSTDWVLAEAVTLARMRVTYDISRKIGDSLLGAGFELIWVDRALADAAWDWFEKYCDQTLSLCDCVSFVTMRKFRIGMAFAYDDDFRIARFEIAGK